MHAIHIYSFSSIIACLSFMLVMISGIIIDKLDEAEAEERIHAYIFTNIFQFISGVSFALTLASSVVCMLYFNFIN